MKQGIEDRIAAAVVGALFGSLIGLGICWGLIAEDLLFVGDTIVAGALICGTLGFIFGDRFVDWLRENWWWFD